MGPHPWPLPNSGGGEQARSSAERALLPVIPLRPGVQWRTERRLVAIGTEVGQLDGPLAVERDSCSGGIQRLADPIGDLVREIGSRVERPAAEVHGRYVRVDALGPAARDR